MKRCITKGYFLPFWSGIVYCYNQIKKQYPYITLFFITFVTIGYADRNIHLPNAVEPINLLGNLSVFFWVVLLSAAIYLVISLLPIKPLTPLIDKVLLTITLSFFVYKLLYVYAGWFSTLSFMHCIYVLGIVVVFFLLRWLVVHLNETYVCHTRELFFKDVPNSMMFKPDKAIKKAHEDKLGRKRYAYELGKAIVSYKEEESFVIGITGEWGSGKSSIINMATEHVKDLCKEKRYALPTIVEFSPWNFSDQNQLVEQFFKAISSSLQQQDNAITTKIVGEKLASYAEVFGQVVASHGTSLLNVPKLIKNILVSVTDNEEMNLKEARNSLDKALRDNPGKIIVIIDDLDRLTSREIRQVFQLIKSIADFPNTIYILSFDKKIVVNTLRSEQRYLKKEERSKYLEKIVQVNLEIPLGDSRKIEKLLNESLEELVIDVPKELSSQIHWANIYIDGIKQYIQNLRDVNRLLNSLRFQYHLVKNEVNVADFFALITLQVFEYDTYCLIRDNRQRLAGGWQESISDKQEKEELKLLLETIDKTSSRDVKPLLFRLFPKLETFNSNITYGYSFQSEWRKTGRISSPDLVDIYFKLDLDNSDIRKSELEEIIKSTENLNLLRQHILNLIKEGRITRFLELLEDYTGEVSGSEVQSIPLSNINNVITVLLDTGDAFPEYESYGFFEIHNPLRIARIAYQLASRINNQEERGKLIIQCVTSAQNSLYPAVYLIHLYDQQHGKFGLKENPDPEDARTVSSFDLDELNRIGLEKIQSWANSGKLMRHDKFCTILLIWKDWAGVEIVHQYIRDNFNNDEFVVALIKGFINTKRSQSMNNYTVTKTQFFDLQPFKLIVPDINSVIERVQSLRDNKSLPDDTKAALGLFIDTINKKVEED